MGKHKQNTSKGLVGVGGYLETQVGLGINKNEIVTSKTSMEDVGYKTIIMAIWRALNLKWNFGLHVKQNVKLGQIVPKLKCCVGVKGFCAWCKRK